MGSELSDTRRHLWAPDPNPLIGMKRCYSVCGVSVGRFVGELENVDCAECLAEAERQRKEKHESMESDGQ